MRLGLATMLATLVWWGNLASVVDGLRPTPDELADELQGAIVSRWSADEPRLSEVERGANPEWDFMARTFVVLALVNDALERPDRVQAHLGVVDRIIADTVDAERTHGQAHFLLPYGRGRPFVDPSGRSVFVDGEIALMLAARLELAPDPDHHAELRRRALQIAQQMRRGPITSAESYPDEAWTFCNTTALVALRGADRQLGTDHGPLVRRWLQQARASLTDAETGLLVSSFTYDGRPLDGPEGSTLWMTVHNLLLLDPDLAQEQYRRAKDQLASGFAGFAWAREWPQSEAFADRQGRDVDSGGVIPILDASPGSSGMMLVAAVAFDDAALRDGLLRSAHLGGFPTATNGGTEFAAAGLIGNAVLLYGLRFGPLWERWASDAPLQPSPGDRA